jgi:nucleoside-diphosphate-sugar epimerase
MRILLTGGSGFVGSAATKVIAALSPDLIVPLRALNDTDVADFPCSEQPKIADINGQTKWDDLLNGVDTVLHCAATNVGNGGSLLNSTPALRAVNTDGTLNLARQAAAAGVKRFIFLSSIKVNGEETKVGRPFDANDMANPQNDYGISKAEAEKGLFKISSDTGLEVVIIRPPLVYGPSVKGNFAKLGALVAKGVPLPLAMVRNQRSFVAIDNLVDLIITCINHSKAANQIFLASDGQDLSTPELLNGIAKAMGRDIKLFSLPSSLLSLGAAMIGKKDEANSLLGSLQLDISKTRDVLGWSPVIDVEEGLRRCFDPNRQS